jgi:ABC-type glycerol-3-phosphate transport system substrate-binding protein
MRNSILKEAIMSSREKGVFKATTGAVRKSVAAFVILLLAAALAAAWYGMLPQPRDKHTATDGRPIVRISMYNSSAYPLWRAFVEKSCPYAAIRWEDNRNAASNVLYMAKHGDVPDIIAIRRFETDTTAALEPYLADLSGLPVTKMFYQRALEPYRRNGKQYWLPGPRPF